jgi:hypothetical protein
VTKILDNRSVLGELAEPLPRDDYADCDEVLTDRKLRRTKKGYASST